ncbi:MAG TPA: hypothetical protein VMI34_00195 [Candidatus Bathyarchaeia archaeon]|nr:hypothetical protein [Candidatus Bathyarchaeia archaeon]
MSKPLTVDQVNYLNVGLMIAAAIVAFRWPFETFLFAYIVLGPLHYLTEISWLHDRGYFTKRKRDYLALVAAAAVVTIVSFVPIVHPPPGTIVAVSFAAFATALVFVLTDRVSMRVLVGGAGLLVGGQIAARPALDNIFGVFLPTIIHVFVFTGLFILAGALRGRSVSGLLSLGVFLAVALAFALAHLAPGGYQPSEYAKSAYGMATVRGTFSQSFMTLNYLLVTGFGLHDFGVQQATAAGFAASINTYLYEHPVALSVMAFIAFAYLYHYLNWFSKTSVIRWNDISRTRLAAVIAVWVISVGLYAYDTAVGFRWLFFLSFSHVLLEFPLNHVTFMAIGRETSSLLRVRRVGASPG